MVAVLVFINSVSMPYELKGDINPPSGKDDRCHPNCLQPSRPKRALILDRGRLQPTQAVFHPIALVEVHSVGREVVAEVPMRCG